MIRIMEMLERLLLSIICVVPKLRDLLYHMVYLTSNYFVEPKAALRNALARIVVM